MDPFDEAVYKLEQGMRRGRGGRGRKKKKEKKK